MEFVRSIRFVDSVVCFDSDNSLIDCIKEWGPNFMVIGDDYKNCKIIGQEYIKEIIFFNRLSNKSTTNILNYANNSNR
jgi:bifunctional ADP-heptose synthase (sugar kinase/adenylyltransferase)